MQMRLLQDILCLKQIIGLLAMNGGWQVYPVRGVQSSWLLQAVWDNPHRDTNIPVLLTQYIGE